MIHIITSENRHLYGPQLWAMHEERRRQCVEKNGWVDLVVLDGGEVDDYDDHRAIYLLGFDDAMRLEVGLRLRPTDDRCICLLYTSPSPRDGLLSRMPSSA